jgi:hypothetical protein
MADALDIKLTLDDVKDMVPEALLTLYTKVSQSRADAGVMRDSYHAAAIELRTQLATQRLHAEYKDAELARAHSALAHVAMRVIEGGLLPNFKGDPQ